MKKHAQIASSRKEEQDPGRGSNWQDYLPLVVLLSAVILSATALIGSRPTLYDDALFISVAEAWMHDFMGLFLVFFATLKLFDLAGFADGFQMYDLLAKRWRGYALVYPFLEMALGLGYLTRWQPMVVYVVTVMVLLFGAMGVWLALRRGLDVHCACMGNLLKVPLSTVALVEDVGMALMALVMIFTNLVF